MDYFLDVFQIKFLTKQICWWLTFFSAQSKPMAAGGGTTLQVQRWFSGNDFQCGPIQLKRWRVTFAFQTKCLRNVPVVNAGYECRRHIDSPWLCPWPSVSRHTEMTSHKDFQASMLTDTSWLAQFKKQNTHTHTPNLWTCFMLTLSYHPVSVSGQHFKLSAYILFRRMMLSANAYQLLSFLYSTKWCDNKQCH